MSDSLQPHGLYSPPCFSVHEDSPGKNIGVSCMPSSRGSSNPRDWTLVFHIAGGLFTLWATRKPKNTGVGSLFLLQGIFPTQLLNQGLLHCRRILYQLKVHFLHTYFFNILFPYRLLQDIEYSSLCYIIGPCWLSALYVVVYIFKPQTNNLSLLFPFLFGNHKFCSMSLYLKTRAHTWTAKSGKAPPLSQHPT